MSSSGKPRMTMEEVARHTSAGDCWTVIHDKVYDLTTFLDEHPGGKKSILKYAGKDGTRPFDLAGHPVDMAARLGKEDLIIGEVEAQAATDGPGPDAVAAKARSELPPLDNVLNTFDFEQLAKHTLSRQAWAYYSSGSDDEITLRENNAAFQRLWLKPRILVNVKSVDICSSILGFASSLPLYITATALGKLAHPEGELAICRAAAAHGVPYMLPTLSSCTLDEMLAEGNALNLTQFTQLYVNSDREVTKRYLQRAEAGGVKAVFLTVDAPQLGRRQKDMQVKMESESTAVQKEDDSQGKVKRNEGTARAISQFIDPSLSWDDLAWLKSVTRMPIILKGVQCAEDAVLAAQHGLAGVVLSNHGGRQMDTARSGIEVLPEVMAALQLAGFGGKMQVFVDGGIRRATDIVKAVALGATAVGIGRPVLYALGTYGQAGIERLLQIYKEEMIMNMRLMGATSVDRLSPAMVQTRDLSSHVGQPPRHSMREDSYIPLATARM